MGEARAIVIRGHRVASGLAADPRFPEGTIRPQLPFLRAAIPDLDAALGGEVYPATINLRLAGHIVLRAPEYRLEGVCWTTHFPPETFYLARARLVIGEVIHPVFLYLPDPATKPDHRQDAGTIELIAGYIPQVRYGLETTLHYPDTAIRLERT